MPRTLGIENKIGYSTSKTVFLNSSRYTDLTKTGLYCKLIAQSKPKEFANQLEVLLMKNYTDTNRLSKLQAQASRYNQLETLRHQDRQALRQSLSAILEVVKHWTVGVPQVQQVAKLGGVK